MGWLCAAREGQCPGGQRHPTKRRESAAWPCCQLCGASFVQSSGSSQSCFNAVTSEVILYLHLTSYLSVGPEEPYVCESLIL